MLCAPLLIEYWVSSQRFLPFHACYGTHQQALVRTTQAVPLVLLFASLPPADSFSSLLFDGAEYRSVRVHRNVHAQLGLEGTVHTIEQLGFSEYDMLVWTQGGEGIRSLLFSP